MDSNKNIEAWRIVDAYGLKPKQFYALQRQLEEVEAVSLHQAWRRLNAVGFSTLLNEEGSPIDVFAGYDPASDIRYFSLRMRFIESFKALVHFGMPVAAASISLKHALEDIYDDQQQYAENLPLFVSLLEQNASHRQIDRAFLGKVFLDSLLFNRNAAVLFCEEAGYPFTRQVVGLTNEIRAQIIGAPPKPSQHPSRTEIPQALAEQPLQVNKRVSTEGSGNTQVRNTCRENEEAFIYIQNMRQQNQATFNDLIPELLQKVVNAGGSTAVAGCLIFPDSATVAAARDAAKYRLKKASEE